VAKRYNAYAMVLVLRTVYGIGADGVIRFAERGVPAPAKVLSALGNAPDAMLF
jgi:hypothetical protein